MYLPNIESLKVTTQQNIVIDIARAFKRPKHCIPNDLWVQLRIRDLQTKAGSTFFVTPLLPARGGAPASAVMSYFH